MSESVGIAELRQNLTRYLRRVQQGERLLVTDRNRPIAELGVTPATGVALHRLLAAGKVTRPAGRPHHVSALCELCVSIPEATVPQFERTTKPGGSDPPGFVSWRGEGQRRTTLKNRNRFDGIGPTAPPSAITRSIVASSRPAAS